MQDRDKMVIIFVRKQITKHVKARLHDTRIFAFGIYRFYPDKLIRECICTGVSNLKKDFIVSDFNKKVLISSEPTGLSPANRTQWSQKSLFEISTRNEIT